MQGKRFRAFATDFDGTLAENGTVLDDALAALTKLRMAGYIVLMVTGREVEDLARIFPYLNRFDMIIAENGGLLYTPQDKIMQRLAEPPPQSFIQKLIANGVGPISLGHCIVATWEPHQQAVLDTIREMGLELHVIFNKGAVMILPPGVDKASGLEAALEHFKIKPVELIAVGDAENDHTMLDLCGFPVAVANAVPALQEKARLVTKHSRGEGVVELIDFILNPHSSLP